MTKRILIRGTNWIGDSVMSVAALREIRRLFPEHHLVLLVKQRVAGIFKDQGLVDEIITLKNRQSSLNRVFQLSKRLRGFDKAILFQNAFEAAMIAFLAGIPERIGYDRDERRYLLTHRASPRVQKLDRHQILYYLDLLYQTGLSSLDYLNEPGFHPNIHLRLTSKAVHRARALLGEIGVDSRHPLIAIHPGAYFGPAKRWITERYAVLADRLIEEQTVEVVIVGSQDESRIAQEIQSFMKHTPRILTGKTDIPDLMGLLSLCCLFISNDSGPMHIAAALEVPQIALFGSTDERATAPFNPRALIIHKHVECSPCLLRECPIDLRCFHRIEVDEVYESARVLLSQDQNGPISCTGTEP